MLTNKNEHENINSIVSSTIKLTRNIDKYPFVKFLSSERKKIIEDEIIKNINNWNDKFIIYDSETKIKNSNISLEGDIINDVKLNDIKTIHFPKKNICIFLNNEDHVNIYISNTTLSLEKEYKEILEIEKKLGKDFTYLATTKYGYLTSKIKNCGLGLKIYIIVHLPGLFLSKKSDDIISVYNNRGYYIKPWLYKNKESEQIGYYLISSKLNFGISENELIKGLKHGIEDLIKTDIKELIEYFDKNKEELTDTIFRSYGILKHALKIGYKEALECITYLRIGLILNVDLNVSIDKLNTIFVKIKEIFVEEYAEENNISEEKARAEIIKSHLI